MTNREPIDPISDRLHTNLDLYLSSHLPIRTLIKLRFAQRQGPTPFYKQGWQGERDTEHPYTVSCTAGLS
jgi:hypothetical protein